MKKISVSLSGHQTSITLEDEFFAVLRKISKKDKISISSIINSIDASCTPESNLSSEIRIYILNRLLKTSKL
ncbi:MAG: ribbon-helix-helix domain-containing protein [Alphaproteobacteria bacterium]|nr:ribbon-helix-helix domain-containing protein [Alphaproteobacteria bacterium]MBN2675571.1 ribbon-helix-helix domain-containing protein [Alphaproteobacteria bacterium]